MRQVALQGGQEPPDLRVERHHFWWEPPDRLRQEVHHESEDMQTITVQDGELWWLYSSTHGAVSNAALEPEERPRHQTEAGERFKPLLATSHFLVQLEFGEIQRKDGVLVVRARPRSEVMGETGPHVRRYFGGADELELEVDAEIGMVRRLTIFFDGKMMSTTDLAEVVFDEVFPDDTFVFVPPPGEEVLPPESVRQLQPYTLEEAAAEAPFAVFFVPELPEGHWRLQVRYRPAAQRPPTHATLALIYSRADGRQSLLIGERAAGNARGGIAWTGSPPEVKEVERNGVHYQIAQGDPKHRGDNQVVFERDGTWLELRSELEIETLLELAASLQPAAPAK